MPNFLKLLASAVIGYLMGSVNPAYIVSRIRGTDIRKIGSNNAGASNALISFGAVTGILCALFDIAKSYFAIKLAERFLCDTALHISGFVAGAACIIGHIFPLFMRFKGGKGLACLGGAFLALGLRTFIVCFAAEMVLALVSDYICLVAISGSVVFPFLLYFKTGSLAGALVFILPCIVILFKHRQNIRRIYYKVEAHISGVWNRKNEQKRVDRYKELIGYKD